VDDGRASAARLRERTVFVVADCERLPRTERVCDDCGAGSAGLPNRQQVPQTFDGAQWAVPAGFEAVRGGWELQAEVARMLAAAKAADAQEDETSGRDNRGDEPGKPAGPPSDEPDPTSQRNFTDPESRITKSKDGFVQPKMQRPRRRRGPDHLSRTN
jgi:hypothetical protein